MTLFHRIAFGLFALVAILAVVGVFTVSHLDLARQKIQIENLVLEKTGRQLQINGDLNATVFPWLGLSFSDVSMGSAEEFADTEFATVSSVEMKVAVLPLLTGRVEIEKVAMQGASLKLLRDADGKTNWDDLMAASAVIETESEDNVMREIEAGAPIIAALSVGDVQIINANVTYTDARDESFLAFNDLNLSTGTVLLSEPFAFESDFNFISSAASGLTSVVGAKGEIAIDLVNNIYVLQQLKLSTVNSGASLPLDPLPLSLNGELVADVNAQSIDITIADGLLTGVPVSGEFHATSWQDNLQLTGSLTSGEFDATPFMDQFEILKQHQFPAELLQSARVSARFEHKEDLLQIREFAASTGDIEVSGDFQIANPSGSGVFSGWIQTNPFDPSPWLLGYGWTSADSSVMRLAQLSADVRQSGQLLSFNQIDFQLDDSNITGSLEVSDIKAEQLPVTYALSVDRINLDNYLDSYMPANLSSLTDAEHRQVPVDALRQLSLEGEINVEEITLAGVNAQNAIIPFVAKDGKLTLKEVKADLYTGSFFTTATLDLQADEPLLSATTTMNGVEAESLLQDMLNKESPLTGIANLSVDLLSRGPDWPGLIEHANGAVSLRVTEGQIRGIDIASRLRSLDLTRNPDDPGTSGETTSGETTSANATNGAVLESSQGSVAVTEFSEYSISAELAEGVLQSDDLLFSLPDLSLTGEGGIDLGTQSMDYLLHISKTSDAEVEQDKLAIPISGSFSDFGFEAPANVAGFILDTFKSGASGKIKVQSSGEVESASPVKERIEINKETSRQPSSQPPKASQSQRTDAPQQNAAATSDQEQRDELLSKEAQRQLELEREKNALKDKLKNNLKNNLNGLLGEN